MKARNFLMVVSALSIAGCSQNEVTEMRQDTNPVLGFNVYTGVPTRGTDVSTTTMQGTCDATHFGGFGIMGYYTGSKAWDTAKGDVAPTFMYNQKVTWDATLNSGTGEWTYSPKKYWPNNTNDKVSFFAYAPYEETGNSGSRVGIVPSGITDTGIPSIEFTLKNKDNLDKMVDLVVADALDKTYNDGTIGFQFAHTLSKMGFKAKLGDDYADLDGDNSFVYITRMWIVGKDGSMSMQTPAQVNSNSKFYTKAKWADLHWNYESKYTEIPTADFSIEKIMNMDAEKITEIWEDGSTNSVSGIKLVRANKDTPKDLFKTNQFLYLIPVNDTDKTVAAEGQGGCEEGDIMIGFHYDIVTKIVGSSPTKYSVSHFETSVPLPAHHMKRGKWYTYTFTINLREIKVKAETSVTPWGTAGDDFTME